MMINRKEGFTLVELLAVIVILAVIMLIAVPIIINTIENSKKKSFENSVYQVMKTFKLDMINESENIGKSYTFPEANTKLKYAGTKMTGGTMFLTPTKDVEVRRLTDGNYCANGNKGNLIVEIGECQINLTTDPVIKKAQTGGSQFLNLIGRYDIESIDFVMVSKFPIGAIDISDKGNGSVMLWTENKDGDLMLEVYIGAINDIVYANPDSSYLFNNIYEIEKINLSNFDTSLSVNMQGMFATAGYNKQNFVLNLGNNFDTSKVTNMNAMFSNTGFNSEIINLDLGNKFDTSKVTNMSNLFNNLGFNNPNFTLNLGNKFNVSKVTNINNTFLNTGKANINFKPTSQVKPGAEKNSILSKFPNIDVTIVSE
jgi:bacterial surface protein 26-residue repeat/prepilin-type N-terminal cleavage/methylation domain